MPHIRLGWDILFAMHNFKYVCTRRYRVRNRETGLMPTLKFCPNIRISISNRIYAYILEIGRPTLSSDFHWDVSIQIGTRCPIYINPLENWNTCKLIDIKLLTFLFHSSRSKVCNSKVGDTKTLLPLVVVSLWFGRGQTFGVVFPVTQQRQTVISK